VTFLNYTDDIVQTYSLDFGFSVESIPALIRPGYRFIGWSFNGEIVDFSVFTMPDEPVLFTPVFEGLTVQLQLITFDRTLIIQATSGEAIGILPTLSMNNGYSFIGWSLAPLDYDQLIDATYVVPNVETLMLFPIWSESNLTIQPSKLNEFKNISEFNVVAWIVFIGLILVFGVYIIKVLKEESIHA
jgi:hypothetical protein